MKRFCAPLILLFALTLQAQNKIHNTEITPEEIKANTYYLASDSMKGKAAGSAEENNAGDYIKNEFQLYGLDPAFKGEWFHEFPFAEKVVVTKENSLMFEIKGKKENLKTGADFATLLFSGNGKASGNLVFAGYGISAPELNYDDYEGIDVKNKIVIVLISNPEHGSSGTKFAGYTSLRTKASLAEEKGAAAIIFVNGSSPKGQEDTLLNLHYDGTPALKNIFVLNVRRIFIDELFKADGMDLSALQNKIDAAMKPVSFEFKNSKTSLRTEVNDIEMKGRNVAGIIEGSDPVLKNEYLLISAPCFNLGVNKLNESPINKGNEPVIDNGDDYRVSGAAGLLEIAEKFAGMRGLLRRSIIFAAYSEEEKEFRRPVYIVNNFPVDIKQVAAMINLENTACMNNENNITVVGSGSSPVWKDLLNKKNNYDFIIGMNDSASVDGNQIAFSNKNIPFLYLSVGTQSDYKTTADSAEKINAFSAAKVANYVFEIALAIDQMDKRPPYSNAAELSVRNQPGRTRVTAGVIPDFSFKGKGCKISGIKKGSPAASAGLKPGDIIIKCGEKLVDNIYDFMNFQQNLKEYDHTEVVALRDGKEITFNLDLSAK